MGFTAKAKNSSEGWGMGFFLIFFSEDEPIINKNKKTNLSSPSSSSSSTSLSPINSLLKRSNSTHLLTKAQSTISLCALLIFITLLLFTLSTFEPTTRTTHFTSRRQLSSIPVPHKTNKKNSPPPWSINLLKHNSYFEPKSISTSLSAHALQGMGTLYIKGTKAMNDLIVAHVIESVTAHELRLFTRLFHRSGLPSRSDLLFIFPSNYSTPFDTTIKEENDSFFKLIDKYKEYNGTGVNSMASFDMTQLLKSSEKAKKELGEPIWGRRIRSNNSEENETESTRLSYGSVVGFDVDELDPENSLAGFLDHVPMSLRRWACYQMLLGRVRRNFKHVMLVDVKELLLLGDPFNRVRSRSPESVHLSSHTIPSKHGKKNWEKIQKQVNSAIIMGGIRGIRRLSAAMLTEIVRAAMKPKHKNSVTESGLFNQLVGNEFILKNINLITSTESIPDVSSLVGSYTNSGSPLSLSKYSVVKRGNSNTDFYPIIMKHICLFPLDSLVYSDC